jgi:hypothetical protein
MADEHHEKAAGGLAGTLNKKQGPFKMWQILAIGLVGGGLLYYYNKKKAAGTTTTSTTTAVPSTVDATGSGTYQPAGSGAGSAGSSSNAGNTGFADNNAWSAAVINYLVGLGDDAGQVNQAVGLYLSSQALTPQQQSFVNAGIQHFGAPPLLVAPVNGTTTGVTGGGTTGGTTSNVAPASPNNLHVNHTQGGVQIVWGSDGVATQYEIHITSNTGHSVDGIEPAPASVQTMFYTFPTVPNGSWTATVTGINGATRGPSGSVGFSS